MNTKLLLVLTLLVLPIAGFSQKAILYKFNYKVPSAYMKQIIKYDKNGNIAMKEVGANRVQDVYTQQLSKAQLMSVCESAVQMLKEKYGYEEIEILYPKNPGSSSDKLDGFPSKGYKRTAKKMPADAYVEIVVNLKDKMVGHPADPEELNEEREMRFELISELTIYDGKQNIINESTSNHTQNIEALFAEEYSTELRENGTFVVKRPYFTQEDIISIFELVKVDYLSTEN